MQQWNLNAGEASIDISCLKTWPKWTKMFFLMMHLFTTLPNKREKKREREKKERSECCFHVAVVWALFVVVFAKQVWPPTHLAQACFLPVFLLSAQSRPSFKAALSSKRTRERVSDGQETQFVAWLHKPLGNHNQWHHGSWVKLWPCVDKPRPHCLTLRITLFQIPSHRRFQ